VERLRRLWPRRQPHDHRRLPSPHPAGPRPRPGPRNRPAPLGCGNSRTTSSTPPASGGFRDLAGCGVLRLSPRRHDSDLADAQWRLIELLLPPPATAGCPEKHPRHEIVNAIPYVARTGLADRQPSTRASRLIAAKSVCNHFRWGQISPSPRANSGCHGHGRGPTPDEGEQLTAHLLRGHCLVDQRREEGAPQAAAEAADLIIGAPGEHLPKGGST
jgi:hypothetical protein